MEGRSTSSADLAVVGWLVLRPSSENVAIDLAAQVPDERGTIVEGTFSSIPDLAETMNYGWLQGSWLPGEGQVPFCRTRT